MGSATAAAAALLLTAATAAAARLGLVGEEGVEAGGEERHAPRRTPSSANMSFSLRFSLNK